MSVATLIGGAVLTSVIANRPADWEDRIGQAGVAAVLWMLFGSYLWAAKERAYRQDETCDQVTPATPPESPHRP